MALEKATITNLETGEAIPVMFNPEEYSLDVGNTFAEIGIPGLRTPPIQYVRGNIRNLNMELFFDTYEETEAEKKDVRDQTRRITSLLDQSVNTQAPPILLFSWGGLNFKCVLESVGQRFTMFTQDGTPVRATLSVAFKEHKTVDIDIRRGLFIGPPTLRDVARSYVIIAGDTLSKIAGVELGDPAAWREIADLNDIDDLRNLEPGVSLIIPRR